MKERTLPTPATTVPDGRLPGAIQAHGLSVALGNSPILKNLDFSVRRGSFTAIIGPNGAGKTTLLRAIAGLAPYSGHLALNGVAVSAWPARDRAREVAFVRQHLDLAFDLSVRDLVSLGRLPHQGWLSKESDDDRKVIEKSINQADLDALAERSVAAMSGGEQRRALLAQALAQEAPVLLLDEPTAHLDIAHQLALMETLQSVVESGRTIVGAFHDIELAARYASDLLVLREGVLAAAGSPSDILEVVLMREVFGIETEISEDAHGLLIRVLGSAV